MTPDAPPPATQAGTAPAARHSLESRLHVRLLLVLGMLWLVAAAFAFFLIGLGSLVVGSLPQPNTSLEVEQFIPQADAQRVQAQING